MSLRGLYHRLNSNEYESTLRAAPHFVGSGPVVTCDAVKAAGIGVWRKRSSIQPIGPVCALHCKEVWLAADYSCDLWVGASYESVLSPKNCFTLVRVAASLEKKPREPPRAKFICSEVRSERTGVFSCSHDSHHCLLTAIYSCRALSKRPACELFVCTWLL